MICFSEGSRVFYGFQGRHVEAKQHDIRIWLGVCAGEEMGSSGLLVVCIVYEICKLTTLSEQSFLFGQEMGM